MSRIGLCYVDALPESARVRGHKKPLFVTSDKIFGRKNVITPQAAFNPRLVVCRFPPVSGLFRGLAVHEIPGFHYQITDYKVGAHCCLRATNDVFFCCCLLPDAAKVWTEPLKSSVPKNPQKTPSITCYNIDKNVCGLTVAALLVPRAPLKSLSSVQRGKKPTQSCFMSCPLLCLTSWSRARLMSGCKATQQHSFCRRVCARLFSSNNETARP